LKHSKKDEKKSDKKEGSLKMLRLDRGGNDKTMGLNQVRLKAQL